MVCQTLAKQINHLLLSFIIRRALAPVKRFCAHCFLATKLSTTVLISFSVTTWVHLLSLSYKNKERRGENERGHRKHAEESVIRPWSSRAWRPRAARGRRAWTTKKDTASGRTMSSFLFGASSRQYRRRFLRSSSRWEALDEIYKIHILSHRQTLTFLFKKLQASVFYCVSNIQVIFSALQCNLHWQCHVLFFWVQIFKLKYSYSYFNLVKYQKRKVPSPSAPVRWKLQKLLVHESILIRRTKFWKFS